MTKLNRIIIHTMGYLILGLGIMLIIKTKIGSFPYDATVYYLMKIINVKEIDFGITSIITGGIITIINFILIRKKEVFFSFLLILVFGFVLSFWGWFLPDSIYQGTFHLDFLIALLGITIVSIALAIIIQNKRFPTSPPEMSLIYLIGKTKNPFISKLIIELTFILIALIMAFILNDFSQITWFSLVTIPLSSVLIHIFNKFIIKIN